MSSRRRAGPADEQRVEALTVAMSLAPGVYSRNRMFDLFEQAGVSRAKSRAATLRGVAKHLARATAISVTAEGGDFALRYQIPAMRLTRVVELSPVELATLRLMAARAGLPCLPADDRDRAVVAAALARLLVAGGATSEIARAARDVARTPAE
ncbi:MAG: hypothetical protein KF819_15600 [Labilithrix sp.]|nr:hypothetical protein [Labilithrix sp.]